MTNTKSKPTGILLAGGKSSRIQMALPNGVHDKSFLPLGSKPLLHHVLARIRSQVDPLIINANFNIERFLSFGHPIVSDTVKDFAGPLAGVLAGMTWAKSHNQDSPFILTVPTDVPFLPLDLVQRFNTSLQKESKSIILARSNGKIHPVIGLWPVSLKHILEDALKSGVRKVLEWTNMQNTLYVDFPFLEMDGAIIDPFFNINTPSDLEKAGQLIKLFESRS